MTPNAAQPVDLRVRQMQLPMIGWPEDVDVEIEGRRRDIGAAMGVMRGIALCRPVALARLPYDVIVGDPFGLTCVPSRKALSRSPPSLMTPLTAMPPNVVGPL